MYGIEKVDIVSDGVMISFSDGNVFYIAGHTLHQHLDKLRVCRFVAEDPTPRATASQVTPDVLVKLLVGRDEQLSC